MEQPKYYLHFRGDGFYITTDEDYTKGKFIAGTDANNPHKKALTTRSEIIDMWEKAEIEKEYRSSIYRGQY